MKLLVGFALTLLCVGLDALHQKPFPAGKKYTYDYYGHHMTSLPDVGNHYAGLAIKSKVVIMVPEHQKLIVQLEDFQTASLDEQLRHIDEDVLDWDFKPVLGHLRTDLLRPISVQYQNGKVVSFIATKEESHESLNIKKAILSLLQLDTSQHADSSNSRNNQATGSNGNDVSTYAITEQGIGGNCETYYVLEKNQWPGMPQEDVLNVTRIRNYRNCIERPQWVRTSHVPVRCADCQADNQHPMGTTATIEYDIRVESSNVRSGQSELVIEEIRSEGQTTLAPFTAQSNTMISNHSQILTLVEVNSKPRNVNIVNPKNHPTLLYKFPTSEWEKEQQQNGLLKRSLTPFLTLSKGDTMKEATQILHELVDEIVRETAHGAFNEKTPVKLHQLLRLVKKMSYNDVEQFYTNECNKLKMINSDLKKICVRVLSMSGSNPAIVYVKYLIASEQVTGEQAVSAVQGFSKNIVEPTAEILREILDLAASAVVTKYSQLYKTTWLTFALLVRQACDGQQDDIPRLPLPPHMQRRRAYCSNQEEDVYVQKIAQALRKSVSREDKLLFIRALGLTELPAAVEPLSQYASGDALEIDDDVIQTAALKALREIGKYAPEEVREIAEKELYDTDNDNSVRIAAIKAVVFSKPDFATMERIAIWSSNENSDDVSGYIYSLFDSMANATHYCNQEVAKNAQQLLSILDEEDDNGILGSNVFESSQIFEELGMSTQTVVSWTGSNSSIVPQSFNLRINNTVAGFSHVPLQINVQTRGIQTVLDRLTGPQSTLLNIKSWRNVLEPESIAPEREFSDINKKLKPKLIARTDDDLFVSVAIKNEREVRQLYVDHKTIIDAIETAMQSGWTLEQLAAGIPVHYHKLSVNHEIKRQVPSLLGLAQVVSYSDPSIFNVRGKVSASMKSRSQDDQSTASNLPASIHLEADLKISYSTSPSLVFGVYNPFKKTVVAAILSTPAHVALPVKVNLDLNLLHGKVSLKMSPHAQAEALLPVPKKLVHFQVKPLVCRYSVLSVLNQCTNNNIIHAKPNETRVVDLSQHALGLPLLLKSVSQRDWNDHASYMDEINNYEDSLSLLNTWWATPNFAYKKVEIFLQPAGAFPHQVAVDLEWTYTPTASEQLALQGKSSNVKGSWPFLSGYARLPASCKTGPDFNSYDRSSYKHTSEPKPWYARQNQYDVQGDQARRIHDNHQVQNDEETYATPTTSKAIVERHSRLQQESVLKVVLTAVAKASGEATLRASYKLTRNENTNIDVVDVKIRATLAQILPSPLVICSQTTIRYPALPCSFTGSMIPANFKQIRADVKINFGECNKETPDINANFVAEKSDEQKKLEREKDDWYFQQCEQDIKNNQKLSYACGLAQEEISSFNKLTLRLTSNVELPNAVKNITHKLDNYLKQSMYKQMSNNPIDVSNPQNELKIQVVFHDRVPALDLEIKKPTEETEFRKVYYEETLPYLQPLNADLSLQENIIDDLTDDNESPSCSVMQNNVNTFDNETLDVQFSNCYHVVAKDCSPNDLFAVSVANIGNGQKKVKINIMRNILRIKPSQSAKGQYEVSVNDESVTSPNDNEYVVLKSSTVDGHIKVVGHVIQYGPQIVVQLPQHAVELTFDGEDLEIEVSNLWRGRVCGVCGEFSGDSDGSLIGPDQCQYADSQALAIVYSIKEFKCDIDRPDKIPKMCATQSKTPDFNAGSRGLDGYLEGSANQNEDEYNDDGHATGLQRRDNPQADEQEELIPKRNRIVFKYNLYCFSTEAYPECKPGMITRRQVTQNVGFHCLDENSRLAQTLAKDRDHRPLLQMNKKRVDMTQRIDVATECVWPSRGN